MYPDLAGKRVTVTGAAQGIGLDIVRAFANAGAQVLAISRQGPEGDAAIDGVEWLACDIRKLEPLERKLDELEARGERMHVLVNNAGVMRRAHLLEASDDDWVEMFDTNVRATFRLSQRFARHMKPRGGGAIVNAASFAATLPSVGHGVYAATKAALVSLTRSMAAEWAPWQIRVNAFSPGVIPTRMTRPALDRNEARMLESISLRRTGSTAEVAAAVLFLASDTSSYITGVNLDVTGGKLIVQDPGSAWG